MNLKRLLLIGVPVIFVAGFGLQAWMHWHGLRAQEKRWEAVLAANDADWTKMFEDLVAERDGMRAGYDSAKKLLYRTSGHTLSTFAQASTGTPQDDNDRTFAAPISGGFPHTGRAGSMFVENSGFACSGTMYVGDRRKDNQFRQWVLNFAPGPPVSAHLKLPPMQFGGKLNTRRIQGESSVVTAEILPVRPTDDELQSGVNYFLWLNTGCIASERKPRMLLPLGFAEWDEPQFEIVSHLTQDRPLAIGDTFDLFSVVRGEETIFTLPCLVYDHTVGPVVSR